MTLAQVQGSVLCWATFCVKTSTCFIRYIDQATALPATIIFFGVALFLTLRTQFVQLRAIPYFFRLLRTELSESSPEEIQDPHLKTINPFQAMFTAMASTIGMGNIVAPAIAIYCGGPGALFWLLIYIFFGSVTKFTEVCFAVSSRAVMPDGTVIGGPMRYLQYIHPWLGLWYMVVVAFLYMSWSALQSNTLALIFAQEAIPRWWIGAGLAIIVVLVLQGGVRRVGTIASLLVPLMFLLYVGFGLFILLQDLPLLARAMKSIVSHAFTSRAIIGSLGPVTMLQIMRAGIYRGIYITEAGLGTSSIAHAVAATKRPSDQGILAMVSMLGDAFLSLLSGLLVIVTGVWVYGDFRSTFIYEAFRLHAPQAGSIVLLGTVTLFVIATVIGNTFSGRQSFALLTHNRWIVGYIAVSVIAIFVGSLLDVKFIWSYTDVLLTLIAIPNVLSLVYLSLTQAEVLQIER
jgi:AGCS family alanine or glycine:cation symporter